MMPVMASTVIAALRWILELGEGCGPNRVLKIMKYNGIAAVGEDKKHKSYGRGHPQIDPTI